MSSKTTAINFPLLPSSPPSLAMNPLTIIAVLFSSIILITALLYGSPLHRRLRPRFRSFRNLNAIVTGGSSGIGLEIAKILYAQGAHVVIVARNKDRLELAKKDIIETAKLEHRSHSTTTRGSIPTTATTESGAGSGAGSGSVHVVSAELSDPDQATRAIHEAEAFFGESTGTTPTTFSPADLLFCFAGQAAPGRFVDLHPNDFVQQIHTNYLSALYTVHAAVSKLTQMSSAGGSLPSSSSIYQRRQPPPRQIVLAASILACSGLYGYSAYGPCKFALRSLAETLTQELAPFHIHVSYCLIPDTDTPGFQQENRTKPWETFTMSQVATIAHPTKVARRVLQGVAEGLHRVYTDFDSFLVSALCADMGPVDWPAGEALAGSFLRIVMFGYRIFWNTVIEKGHQRRCAQALLQAQYHTHTCQASEASEDSRPGR